MKHITAVIRSDRLEAVEAGLRDAGAPGVSVSTVKGYGEYANFFSHDWMVRHVRVEVFADDAEAARLADIVTKAARSGAKGDGIVAVEPVDSLVHIRSGESRTSRAPVREARIVSPGDSAAVSRMWYALTVAGLLAIAVSVVVSAKHQLHVLSLSLLFILVLSAALGLYSLTRGRGRKNGGGKNG